MDQAFLERLAQTAFERRNNFRQFQRFLQQAERIAGLQCCIGLRAQSFAGLASRCNQLDDLASDFIGRCRIRSAAWKNEYPEKRSSPTIWQVSQKGVQCFLGLVHQCADRPLNERQIGRTPPLIFKMLEHR